MDTAAESTAAPAATPAAEPVKESVQSLPSKYAALKGRLPGQATSVGGSVPPPVDATPKPPEPAAAKPADPDLEAVARILEQDKRVKAEAKRVAEERAAVAAEREKWKTEQQAAAALRESIAKRDAIGALRAAGFTDAEIFDGDDSILFKLADQRSKKPELDERAKLEAVANELLAKRDTATREAEAEKAKEAERLAKQKIDEANAAAESAQIAYSENIATIAAKNPDKYPALAEWGVKVTQVTKYAWDVLVNSKGQDVLTEEEALDHMETYYREKSRAAAGVQVTPEKTVPKPGPNPNWQASAGAPAKEQPRDMRGKWAAFKESAKERLNQKK